VIRARARLARARRSPPSRIIATRANATAAARLAVTGFARNAAVGLLACLAAAAAFALVAMILDGGDLRALASRARARITRRPV